MECQSNWHTHHLLLKMMANRLRYSSAPQEKSYQKATLPSIRLQCFIGKAEFHTRKKFDVGPLRSFIPKVGSLTHAHIRANIACGLYFFMAKEILTSNDPLNTDLKTCLQRGIDHGFSFYENFLADTDNLQYYRRIRDLRGHSISNSPSPIILRIKSALPE